MSSLRAVAEKPASVPIRFAGLAGRSHGDPEEGGPAFVLLHGLTFDRSMWYPVLDELPEHRRAIAFDLPGHGGSPGLRRRGLAAVVDAVHDAVVAAGLEAPVIVGHSIGGPIASIYAATYPASGVVSVEAPIRFEPFAATLRTLGPQLAADFDATWAHFRDTLGLELLTPAERVFVHERSSAELVLGYQSDLLERPLDDVVRWREEGLGTLRRARTPYVSLHSGPVEPEDRAFLADRLPQAELVVWPVGHHFPHLAEPARFARLLTGLAEHAT